MTTGGMPVISKWLTSPMTRPAGRQLYVFFSTLRRQVIQSEDEDEAELTSTIAKTHDITSVSPGRNGAVVSYAPIPVGPQPVPARGSRSKGEATQVPATLNGRAGEVELRILNEDNIEHGRVFTELCTATPQLLVYQRQPAAWKRADGQRITLAMLLNEADVHPRVIDLHCARDITTNDVLGLIEVARK